MSLPNGSITRAGALFHASLVLFKKSLQCIRFVLRQSMEFVFIVLEKLSERAFFLTWRWRENGIGIFL